VAAMRSSCVRFLALRTGARFAGHIAAAISCVASHHPVRDQHGNPCTGPSPRHAIGVACDTGSRAQATLEMESTRACPIHALTPTPTLPHRTNDANSGSWRSRMVWEIRDDSLRPGDMRSDQQVGGLAKTRSAHGLRHCSRRRAHRRIHPSLEKSS